MAFSDPAGGFFSPTMPSGGEVNSPSIRLSPLPQLENINSPRAQPFELIKPVQYEPDKTAGVALAGAAQAIQNSVSGIDSAVRQTIDTQARQGVSDILNRQIQAGLDTRQDLIQDQGDAQTNGLKDAPTGLTQGISRLDTLDKAARSGAMSNTQFYAQANTLVADLKNKFPGYGSVIDDKIRSVTGTDPAEALRTSIQKDIDALKKAQQARMDKVDSYLLQHQDVLPMGWQNRSRDENLEEVRSVLHKRAEISDANAEIDAKLKQGIPAAMDAAKAYSWQRSLQASDIWNKFQEAYQQATGKTINDLTSGKLSPEDAKNAIGLIRQFQTTWQQLGPRTLSQSLTPMSDKSNTMYNAFLYADKQALPGQIDKTLDPFQRMIDAIGQGNMDLFKLETSALNAQVDRRTSEFYAQNPKFRDSAIILKNLGPAAPAIVNSTAGQQFTADIVSQSMKLMNATADDPFSDQMQQHRTQYKQMHGGNEPTDYAQHINDKITILSSPGVEKNTELKQFRSVYLDPRNTFLLDSIKNGNGGINGAMDTFLKLTNPQITSKVAGMPDDIKQGYSKFATDNFSKLSISLGDDIKNQVQNSPYFNIGYDPKTNQFVTVPTADAAKNPTRAAMLTNNIQPSLARLNAGLAAVKPAIEQAGGDVAAYGSLLDRQLGLSTAGKGGLGYTGENRLVPGSKARTEDITPGLNISTTPQNNSPEASLLDLIGKGESGGNYDSLFGVKGAKVSSMTVGEVLAKQEEMRNSGAKSTAAGKHQFINGTLKELVNQTGLDLNTPFNKETQDKLALQLLKKRGLDDYRAGKISKYDFVNNLSKEWAALPNMSGRGTYDGDGLNKSNITLTDLLTSIDSL